MRRAVICLVLVLLCSTGCESSLESVDAEDFDADHGLRSLRHERGLDFEWVNTRMQHVVRVELGGGAGTCSGVLVAPDLVLTAAHCLRNTAYMNSTCGLTLAPGGGTIPEGNVILDHQFEQDTHTNGEPLSGIRRMPRRAVGIVEIVAHPRTNVFVPVFTPREECRFPLSMRHFDGVLLRLQTPVFDRGFARIRTTNPQAGELMPVIHTLVEKTVSAVVMQPDASPGGGPDDPSPDAHIGREIDFPILPVSDSEQLIDIDPGSSGAPLFDEEGYVVGLVSRPLIPGEPEVVFASLASLLSLPEFQSALQPREETSSFALGQFGTDPFGDLGFERSRFGPAAEMPRAVVERPEGGFYTAGFATNSSGQHILALVGYDESGAIDPSFGSVVHDINSSTTEELFDIAMQSVGSETRPVVVGNMTDPDALPHHPDSIAVMRFDLSGNPDGSFGTGGLVRLNAGDPEPSDPTLLVLAGDGGVSGAAILVDPADQSLVVVGHAAVEINSALDRLHGSPVVFRLNPDGTSSIRCGGPEGFIWRPGSNLLQAQTLREVAESLVSPTYDMVVTDAALDSTGGIIMVGYVHMLEFHARASWIGRLDADCEPDSTFGPGGSGVRVLNAFGFAGASDAENSWFSAIAIEPGTDRIFVGGTLTRFDPLRGFFAGNMFVVAFLPDGSIDETGFVFLGTAGGAVVPREGWHEEARGIVWGRPSPSDEPRVTLVGSSYVDEFVPLVGESTRRVRVARFFTDGPIDAVARPGNALGVVDAVATDAAVNQGGSLFISVALRTVEP